MPPTYHLHALVTLSLVFRDCLFARHCLLISQLTSISGGRPTIRHLRTRLVACSSAPTTTDTLKRRLHKFWQHQDILYDHKVELTGVGNRSQINTDDNIVLKLHFCTIYGRTLSERPCYILQMFFSYFFNSRLSWPNG